MKVRQDLAHTARAGAVRIVRVAVVRERRSGALVRLDELGEHVQHRALALLDGHVDQEGLCPALPVNRLGPREELTKQAEELSAGEVVARAQEDLVDEADERAERSRCGRLRGADPVGARSRLPRSEPAGCPDEKAPHRRRDEQLHGRFARLGERHGCLVGCLVAELSLRLCGSLRGLVGRHLGGRSGPLSTPLGARHPSIGPL